MKLLATILCLFMLGTVSAKETVFTASTPAGTVVRAFLGISITDSVDFIRWKIILNENKFQVHCNYGISKPNTNGFINGGFFVHITGTARFQFPYWHLYTGTRHLAAVALNKNLLHLLDADNHPLTGNGGWSYTLNNTTPTAAGNLSWKGASPFFSDSLDVEGRTPCDIPGIRETGGTCYKLKWHIIFYADAGIQTQGRYNIPTVPFHKNGGRTGRWKMVKDNGEKITYQLYDINNQVFLRLAPVDNNILLFADANGNLLVGDEDFSYTLNRRIRP